MHREERRSRWWQWPALPRAAAWLAIAVVALVACSRSASPTSPPPSSGGGPGAAVASAPAPRDRPAAGLTLAAEGRVVAELSPDDLVRAAPPVDVAVFDPLYKGSRRYRALPLRSLLEAGFPRSLWPLEAHDFLLRARDGFTVPISGARLLEEGALLAFADLDHPGWEPVGPTRALPGPLYLVWSRPDQLDVTDHPRPYQLARIDLARIEDVFPHAVPRDAPEGSPPRRGFALFRTRCLACHAINREGGRVGPELNVPQSIVEYRPVEQIRAYIRNPLTFRYGHMPAHPDLGDADLGDLVDYFRFMRGHKFDPEASPAPGPGR